MPTPVEIALRLRQTLAPLRFGPPVTHVYQPLDYAWEGHRAWLEAYGTGPREVLLLGMNPGPWGMAQTGVPFGQPQLVEQVLGLHAEIDKPDPEHPRRPVSGFGSTRRDVGGERIWGWVQETFGGAAGFFARFAIVNYCPLSFMEASGKNRTPDKLPAGERAPLFAACDAALLDRVRHHRPAWVVGIGGFAEKRARRILAALPEAQRPRVGRILHPSPASPLANRGWAPQATADLAALGLAPTVQGARSSAGEGTSATGSD